MRAKLMKLIKPNEFALFSNLIFPASYMQAVSSWAHFAYRLYLLVCSRTRSPSVYRCLPKKRAPL